MFSYVLCFLYSDLFGVNYVLGFYFYLLDLIMVEILKFDTLVYCVD